MSKGDRKSKVTPEHKAEAHRLSALWESRSHPSQAVFADKYDIGNQSAVSQFLRGEIPLSLKAAIGFAQGLGCRIEDFSPRLASEAATIASMVTGGGMLPEIADLAWQIQGLTKDAREKIVFPVLRTTIAAAKKATDASSEDAVKRENHTDKEIPSPIRRRVGI